MNKYYGKLNKVNGGFTLVDNLRNIYEINKEIKIEMSPRRTGKKAMNEYLSNYPNILPKGVK